MFKSLMKNKKVYSIYVAVETKPDWECYGLSDET